MTVMSSFKHLQSLFRIHKTYHWSCDTFKHHT